jgi:ABC-type sugar transport system substrate-binding protein
MDYVIYTVDEDLAVGELMEQHASKTPQECMAACATNGCELVSLALPNVPDLPGLVRWCAAAAAAAAELAASGVLCYCCSWCHHLQCSWLPSTYVHVSGVQEAAFFVHVQAVAAAAALLSGVPTCTHCGILGLSSLITAAVNAVLLV